MRAVRMLMVTAVIALGAAPAASAGYDPGVAGTNDFACRPSAAHPRPLVLVHGLGATMTGNWYYLAPKLKAAGYCVFALTYGVDSRTTVWPYSPGGAIPMEQSANELAAFIDRVLAATGVDQVDLVGHSEGTVMPRYYLKHLASHWVDPQNPARDGLSKVNTFVAMTPLWRGTNVGEAATLRDAGHPYGADGPAVALAASWCGSCPEFLTGSAFMNDLNAGGEATPGVRHYNLITRYDELVQPYTSGVMNDPNATNIVVQDVCPTDTSEHLAMAFDPVVFQMIVNGLDPAHAKPVTCVGTY